MSLSALAFSGEISSPEGRAPRTALNSFQDLTRSLNQIAQKNKVSFSIPSLSTEIPKLSKPQILEAKSSAMATEAKPASDLPALSVDKTQVGAQQLGQLGFDSYGNLNNLIQTAEDTLKSEGLLNLPKARVLDPSVGEKWSSKQPLEGSPKKPDAANADVLTALSPNGTRFGKDRYDENPFQNSAESNPLPLQRIENAFSAGAPTSAENPQSDNSNWLEKEDQEDPEIKKQKEARENFEKTMKEFAERTEDKEAFQLVDYYDLRNVLSKNENLFNSFENDDIDERFIKNAQTIFERFGEKDSSLERRAFEKFLRKVQPPTAIFGNPALRRQQNGIGRRPEVHQQ